MTSVLARLGLDDRELVATVDGEREVLPGREQFALRAERPHAAAVVVGDPVDHLAGHRPIDVGVHAGTELDRDRRRRVLGPQPGLDMGGQPGCRHQARHLRAARQAAARSCATTAQ